MKEQIEQIINHYRKEEQLPKFFEMEVRRKIDYLLEEEENLIKAFKLVTQKYDIEFIKNFDKSDVHLSYWRGSGDYGLALCPDSEIGVHARDEEFKIILEDYYESKSYQNYRNEKKRPFEYQTEFSEEEEMQFTERTYKLYDRLYHSIIGCFWQSANGFENGLISSIIENNSIRTFIFNDLCWADYSDYKEIKSEPKFRKRHFNRDLSLIEIYSRSLLYSYRNEKPIKCYYEKYDKFWEIVVFKNRFEERSGRIENYRSDEYEKIEFKSENNYLDTKSAFKHFKKKSDELINSNWVGKLKEASP